MTVEQLLHLDAQPLPAADLAQVAEDAAGAGGGDVRLVIFFLAASHAAALLFRMIPPRPMLRHAFSIIATTISWLVVFGSARGLVHVAAMGVGVWAAMHAAGRIAARAAQRARSTAAFVQQTKRIYDAACWIACVGALAHLTAVHASRDPHNRAIDHSSVLMVLVIKATSFAWAVRDGAVARSANSAKTSGSIKVASSDGKSAGGSPALTPYQERHQISSLPGLLPYLGYVFFFGGFLIGPAVEYADYAAFIGSKLTPFKLRTFMRELLAGIGCIAVHFVLGMGFNYARVVTPFFSSLSLLEKLVYLEVACVAERCKYYGAWTLFGAPFTVAGFTGAHTQIRPRQIETSPSLKSVVDGWNMRTANWLREYVYVRLVRGAGFNRSVATIATYFASACWHGPSAGFYLMFLTAALATIASRVLYKRLTTRGTELLGWLFTQHIVSYFAIPFQLLNGLESLYVWREIYFCGHVMLFAVLAWDRLQKHRSRGRERVVLEGGHHADVAEKVSLPPRPIAAAPMVLVKRLWRRSSQSSNGSTSDSGVDLVAGQ